ncbi:cytochrome c oxidase assembly protein [Mycobacterium sp. CBMA293]|nr:cytochrome c oxidase assembly protein [Mycolicibacterium sp. CBMA 360]MUL59738.1 cytochrome c oxidase assembly protein [Mycolicibacterium sp. CBMA 335]MUL68581.1 cytochrome c oxidase assembly protein [Mycolicibacterium sp. CBMA 311]MUL94028.1 cytochrome c oxidase assembly protein [Mycolicibacterium sp. CBMA 230]MUM06274.1 copper resistance protein CopD [Mycolicibacterium sp. CBMA 213]MUM12712.1 cytochrome c oxidase assembly protein [Mycolicibacterium sp. CBMA 293]MUM31694.1 cytochrome c ox
MVLMLLGIGALLWTRRRTPVTRSQLWCFGLATVVWAVSTLSALAVYAPMLFWVRALQVLLLLYVVPFFFALSRPVATARAVLSPPVQERVDVVLNSALARLILSPPVTSVLMLVTPWLLYMTPWYVASMTGPLAAVTRLLLLGIGFAYFYARLQVDPVPRRYPPLLSIGISVAEGLGDGILGLVLWLGPVIAYDYYAGLHRDFGPSIRLDQTFGAGILWVLGDVLSVPFILLLMRALGSDERRKAAEVDAELDAAAAAPSTAQASAAASDVEPAAEAPSSGLWWQNDPQLRDRYR